MPPAGLRLESVACWFGPTTVVDRVDVDLAPVQRSVGALALAAVGLPIVASGWTSWRSASR